MDDDPSGDSTDWGSILGTYGGIVRPESLVRSAVVGLDGTANSRAALEWVCHSAAPSDVVHAVHVHAGDDAPSVESATQHDLDAWVAAAATGQTIVRSRGESRRLRRRAAPSRRRPRRPAPRRRSKLRSPGAPPRANHGAAHRAHSLPDRDRLRRGPRGTDEHGGRRGRARRRHQRCAPLGCPVRRRFPWRASAICRRVAAGRRRRRAGCSRSVTAPGTWGADSGEPRCSCIERARVRS